MNMASQELPNNWKCWCCDGGNELPNMFCIHCGQHKIGPTDSPAYLEYSKKQEELERLREGTDAIMEGFEFLRGMEKGIISHSATAVLCSFKPNESKELVEFIGDLIKGYFEFDIVHCGKDDREVTKEEDAKTTYLRRQIVILLESWKELFNA